MADIHVTEVLFLHHICAKLVSAARLEHEVWVIPVTFSPVNEGGAQLEFQDEFLQFQQDLRAHFAVFFAIVGLVHARRIN